MIQLFVIYYHVSMLKYNLIRSIPLFLLIIITFSVMMPNGIRPLNTLQQPNFDSPRAPATARTRALPHGYTVNCPPENYIYKKPCPFADASYPKCTYRTAITSLMTRHIKRMHDPKYVSDYETRRRQARQLRQQPAPTVRNQAPLAHLAEHAPINEDEEEIEARETLESEVQPMITDTEVTPTRSGNNNSIPPSPLRKSFTPQLVKLGQSARVNMGAPLSPSDYPSYLQEKIRPTRNNKRLIKKANFHPYSRATIVKDSHQLPVITNNENMSMHIDESVSEDNNETLSNLPASTSTENLGHQETNKPNKKILGQIKTSTFDIQNRTGPHSVQLNENFRMHVSGPSGSGKTFFVNQLLLNLTNFCEKPPKRIIYVYYNNQEAYANVQHLIHTTVEVTSLGNGDPDRIIEELINMATDGEKENVRHSSLIVFDDCQDEKQLLTAIGKLFNGKARHHRIALIYISQKLFHGVSQRQIASSVEYLVIFKNNRHRDEISYLNQQLFPQNRNILQSLSRGYERYLFIQCHSFVHKTPYVRFLTDLFDYPDKVTALVHPEVIESGGICDK